MRSLVLILIAALGLAAGTGCPPNPRTRRPLPQARPAQEQAAQAQPSQENAPQEKAPAPKPRERRGTEVELTVRDVDDDLLTKLQEELARSPKLKGAQLKNRTGKTAVFTLLFREDIEELPELLSKLPQPGIRFGSAVHKVDIAAFDNEPPQLTFVYPQAEQVLNAREQFITVEAPDKDVASITINGKGAPAYKGRLYRTKLILGEGQQEVVAIARDRAGNETVQRVTVVVDTTPPAVNAQVRLVVEGAVEPGSTVLIDGMEVEVGRDGRYRAEVPVRKGQRKVEVVAIDQTGNKTVTHRDIGN
jgi:hypothetical protein